MPTPVSCAINLAYKGYCSRARSNRQRYIADPHGIGFNDQWANRESSPLPVISMNAPITSFTYGLVPNKKLPILLDVLSSTSRGVNNIWWRGRDGGEWLGPESPTVMSGVNNYTALAAHGWAHVYAMQGQEIKEFKVEDDGRTWTMRGSVPTS